MIETDPQKVTLQLIVDSSDESRQLEEKLRKLGISYTKVYAPRDSYEKQLPAIQTPFGTIGGYDNIRRYFILE